jgi:serine/threonine protein kinase
MVDQELESLYSTIMSAVSPEDIFGVTDIVLPPDDLLRFLETEYLQRKEKLNPDKFSEVEEQEMAKDALYNLDKFYKTAQEKIKQGIYGLNTNPLFHKTDRSFSTGTRTYYVGEALNRPGDLSTVYQGFCEVANGVFGEVIIKVIEDSADSDLMQKEIQILRLLHDTPAPQWKHLPFLLDSFKTDNGKIGLVLRRFNGYDFLQVRDHWRYKKGVDRKDMVWMLNRTLSGIGYPHSVGVVHCNLEPSHFMLNPSMHNVCLLDWSYSAYLPSATGDCFQVFTPNFSAPEVLQKKPPIPASDIYSIGKVMIWLLGGNVETNEMPDSVEEELQTFLRGFVLESPLQRPQNAWKLHGQLVYLVEKLWGKRKFRPFLMD